MSIRQVADSRFRAPTTLTPHPAPRDPGTQCCEATMSMQHSAHSPLLTIMGPNLSAQCYLRAFADDLPITGGLLGHEALRAARLDYSLSSLDRLDQLLDGGLGRPLVLAEQLLQHPGMQNTVFLLGFYAGELLGRALGETPLWEPDPTQAAAEPVPAALRAMGGQAVCRYASGQRFAPLALILQRLFAGSAQPGLAAAVAARLPAGNGHRERESPLPVLAATRWPLGLPGARPAVAAEALADLRPYTPFWADAAEPLSRLFHHVDELLRDGRVVWAALVQANERLFQPKFEFGAPGDVLYDPQGRVEPASLVAVADLLFQAKVHGTEGIDDPQLARYAEHLRDERTRQFGFAIAGRVLPYPLCASTTYFDQRQLPDGMLSQRCFPLLVSDSQPGLVLPLPQALWPEAFREAWLAAGEARHGERFDPRAAHAAQLAKLQRERTDPAPLFREGMRHWFGEGVPRDYRKARELLEQAAACGDGHALALNNLGVMYEQGLGVAVDLDKQQDYYTAAAERGEPQGQLNLGRFLLARGRLDEAMPYLRAAAAAGVEEARLQLRYIAEAKAGRSHRPDSGAAGALQRLLSLFRR
jgi:tetratricopeptide (TPR) repeat protein